MAEEAAPMNAKERRKLLREQERLATEAAKAAAAATPVKAEATSEATATPTDAPLNAKQRRKLVRAAAEEAQKASAAAAAVTPAKGTIKAEKPEATAAIAPATTSTGERLNAKQRRLLARKTARPDAATAAADAAAALADAKAKVKALKSQAKSAESSKKRKRTAGDSETNAATAKKTKKVKSIHLTLFVGQLPFNTTEAQLRQHFQEAGDIKVRMATDKRTNKFKGTAFIEVADSKALGAALSRHHTLLHGRRINVEMTAGGGGTKSELRRSKIDLLRKKQGNVQVEKTKALIQKHIDSREYKLSADDVDDRMIDFLSWFDYETAKNALEEYNRCVSDRVLNRKAFFMGILKRFRQTDGVE